MPARYPERIVCLTEETTETLYLLGEERRIVGISGYTVLASMVGAAERGAQLVSQLEANLAEVRGAAARLAKRPKVYFEEWDQPMFSAIRWVSELIEIAGGEDVFSELSLSQAASGRTIADPGEVARRNPDVIIGSWCGKKFRPERVAARPGWDRISAVKQNQLHEIKSSEILQPGPAALTDGVRRIHAILAKAGRHP